MTEKLYQGGGFSVTNSVLITPKQSYDLKNVESISVKQPLLIIAVVLAIGLWAFAVSFFRYLYPMEIIGLFAVPLVALVAAKMTGTLKIQSIALRDDGNTMYGLMTHLRKVKQAVETAMDSR